MSTDEEPGVATTADKQLQEMEKKHPQFLQSQVLNGIKLSLQLQRILAGYKGPATHLAGLVGLNQSGENSILAIPEEDIPVVRGYRVRPKESPSALNGFLYSLLRSTKPQRRAIVLCLLKQFDDQNVREYDLPLSSDR
jgi:cohesin loading factor subunit SCC2